MLITRFAPSPTGDLHIGGVRTALFSWLVAKQKGGEFRLRIEDTDLERSTEASTQVILKGMEWLGLDYQGEVIYQSRRTDIYNAVIDDMIAQGLAYYCWCTPEELEEMRAAQKARGEKPRYNGKYRNGGEPVDGVTPVVRFKNPLEGTVSWHDHVRGVVTIDNSELDDFIIRRSDGMPTYNFCVVIDDHAQDIGLVIRGDDHVSNTPRQINLYRALGYQVPEFAHVPMILGDDGKRLSKRHGATNVLDYQKEGYLPEAIINYLVRLGWAYGDQEIFSIEELLTHFSIDDVHSAPSTFNTEKLRWLNQQYLMHTDIKELARLLPDFCAAQGYQLTQEQLLTVVPHYQERAKTLREMAEMMRWVACAPEKFPEAAAKKAFKNDTAQIMQLLITKLQALQDFDEKTVHDALAVVVSELNIGFGKMGQPARLAITGGLPSPDLALCFALIGKENALQRLQYAIKFMTQNQ